MVAGQQPQVEPGKVRRDRFPWPPQAALHPAAAASRWCHACDVAESRRFTFTDSLSVTAHVDDVISLYVCSLYIRHQRPAFSRHGGDCSAAGVPLGRHLETHIRYPGVQVGLYDLRWPTAYRRCHASCWSVVIRCHVRATDVWRPLLYSRWRTCCSIK